MAAAACTVGLGRSHILNGVPNKQRKGCELGAPAFNEGICMRKPAAQLLMTTATFLITAFLPAGWAAILIWATIRGWKDAAA